ncbi:MAG: hypothetical protein OEY14_13190, partial [Myxococcales bacterium]|nr:hypothetical protein [Myxococcales bacterium]
GRSIPILALGGDASPQQLAARIDAAAAGGARLLVHLPAAQLRALSAEPSLIEARVHVLPMGDDGLDQALERPASARSRDAFWILE